MIGPGFDSIEKGNYYRPAYCDHCENVKTVGSEIENPRCPTCRRLMGLYEGRPESPDALSSIDYTGTAQYCPRCKSNSLQFEDIGMWD